MVAAVNGFDAMAYLKAPPFEAIVETEVVKQVQKVRRDIREAEIKALGVSVANSLAKAMRGKK